MPRAFLNGQFVPAEQAAVPVYDAGFMLGATVAEQIRTFRGKLFHLDRHLQRLFRSLEIVDIDPGISMADLAQAANELAFENHRILAEGDDLGLSIFVTPGPYPTMAAAMGANAEIRPMVCMHTYPLPFAQWATVYQTGQRLVVTDIEQVPQACWPAELKCRSRMHYYLADNQARRIEAGSRALMLDSERRVLEASTANIILYSQDLGIISPPAEYILPGVSVSVVAELAAQLGIPFVHRDIRLEDIYAAEEAMLCSTSPCVWPIAQLNGRRISDSVPGPVAQRLLAAWGESVGLDIEKQALRFAKR